MATASNASKVSITLYGDDAARVRRVAGLLPHATVNKIGARAIERGLDAIERELRDAATKLVGELDREGL